MSVINSYSFLSFIPFVVNVVYGDYCDFGFCEEQEYCCGQNRCCKKTADIWYYWAAVLLIVISIIIAVRFYCNRRKPENDTSNLLTTYVKQDTLYQRLPK